MRFIVAVTVLLALNANNGAFGLIGPISISLNILSLEVVVDLLPNDFGEVLQSVAVCMNPRPDPELEGEIQRYERGDRQACCQAEDFPRIFTAFAKLSQCFEDAYFARTNRTVCGLLYRLAPIAGCSRNERNPGCLLKSLLGPIFGKAGKALAALIADVAKPLNQIDGCITSGSTQMYHRITSGDNDGDSQTPVGTVAEDALGGLLAISKCLQAPFASMTSDTWDEGVESVAERCESEIISGF